MLREFSEMAAFFAAASQIRAIRGKSESVYDVLFVTGVAARIWRANMRS